MTKLTAETRYVNIWQVRDIHVFHGCHRRMTCVTSHFIYKHGLFASKVIERETKQVTRIVGSRKEREDGKMRRTSYLDALKVNITLQ